MRQGAELVHILCEPLAPRGLGELGILMGLSLRAYWRVQLHATLMRLWSITLKLYWEKLENEVCQSWMLL